MYDIRQPSLHNTHLSSVYRFGKINSEYYLNEADNRISAFRSFGFPDPVTGNSGTG